MREQNVDLHHNPSKSISKIKNTSIEDAELAGEHASLMASLSLRMRALQHCGGLQHLAVSSTPKRAAQACTARLHAWPIPRRRPRRVKLGTGPSGKGAETLSQPVAETPHCCPCAGDQTIRVLALGCAACVEQRCTVRGRPRVSFRLRPTPIAMAALLLCGEAASARYAGDPCRDAVGGYRYRPPKVPGNKLHVRGKVECFFNHLSRVQRSFGRCRAIRTAS